MSDSTDSLKKPILLVTAGALVLAVIALVWQQQENKNLPTITTEATDPYAAFVLEEPTASYQMLRYVAERGGDEHQRRFAIDWLEEQTRLRIPPKPEQEAWLLSVLEKGGHSSWDIESQLWIFNDAFAYLHMGTDQARFTRIMQHLALEHPHKTMRLYALQHIILQRSLGHLDGPFAIEVLANLEKMATETHGELAGSALIALVNWNGSESAPSEKLIQLAKELAADPARPVDIRVTAMHAVGHHTLEVARAVASDLTQPVLVRKAAIACIGHHGSESDTAALKQLANENFRIAQAAEPALQSIRQSKSH